MIGSVSNIDAFPTEKKYRCIIHNTCSDYPCLPCSIKSACSIPEIETNYENEGMSYARIQSEIQSLEKVE